MLDDTLRTILTAHVVDDPGAPPNYSLAVNPGDARRAAYHFLFHCHSPFVRTRSPRRLVTALLRQLHEATQQPRRDRLQVRGLALVGTRAAVLVPTELRRRLDRLEPRLRRAGAQPLDDLVVDIDPATGEVVVEPPHLHVDEPALARLDTVFPEPRRPDGVVEPGRYRLRAWLHAQLPHKATPADAVVRTLPLVANRGALGSQRLLDLLAEASAAVTHTAVPSDNDRDLSRALAALVRS